MIRVVALRKAITAGLAGAAVIEAVSFLGARAGLPTVDLVSELSSSEFRNLPMIAPAIAIVAHFAIGVCWAVFYAFFFFGRFKFRPAVQGLLFALLPATLAILVVYPELALMRTEAPVVQIGLTSFFAPLTLPIVVSLFLVQLLFGLTVGLLYARPVGYKVDKKPAPPPARRPRHDGKRRKENSSGFMFATGIECSYPTIENGQWRRDEMDSTRHYEMWQRDFELAREIGITHIRYGPPLHLIFEGPS